MYVMTSEYGAASQLEKIDMLDFAGLRRRQQVREARRRGCAARRAQAVAAQPSRPGEAADDDVPVFPTIASQFNDAGVNRLFAAVCERLDDKWGRVRSWPVAGLAPLALPRARRSFRQSRALPCRDRTGRAPDS